MNPHEIVLCVPSEVFGDLNGYESLNRQGFNLHQPSARVKRLREYLTEKGPLWKKRMTCENDPSLLQLIPYVIVTVGRLSLLTYQRGQSGGEKRLHKQRSIGVGGHINKCDVRRYGMATIEAFRDPLRAIFYIAALRELQEELRPNRPFIFRNLSVRGFIRCHKTPVDRVHAAVVFEYRCPGISSPAMRPIDDIADPMFLTAAQVREQCLPIGTRSVDKSKAKYERWSMELLPHLRKDFAVV